MPRTLKLPMALACLASLIAQVTHAQTPPARGAAPAKTGTNVPAPPPPAKGTPLSGVVNYSYSPLNKRDPFLPPVSFITRGGEEELSNLPVLQRYTLDQLKITAIVWNAQGSGQESRILVKDPKGRSHFVKEGDNIGKDGQIVRINKTDVIIAVKTKDVFGNEKLSEEVKTLAEPVAEKASGGTK